MISVYRGTKLVGDTVSPTNRALWYGEGTFTTTRILAGRALFLARHVDRILQTLDYFQWGRVTREELLFAVRGTMQRANVDAGILRVLVSSGDGHGMTTSGPPEIVVSITEGVPHPRRPLRVVTASQPPAAYSGHKLSSYMHHTHLFQSEIQRRPGPPPDEVLRVWQGRVLEGTRSNLFVWTGTELWTPPAHNVLNGITRQTICERLPSLGIPFRESDLTMDDLRQARSVFLTSSLLGIAPVATIDGHRVEEDAVAAATTEALNQAFHEVILRDN